MKREDGKIHCDYESREDCSGPPRWSVRYLRHNALIGTIEARHDVCDAHLAFDCDRADGTIKVQGITG